MKSIGWCAAVVLALVAAGMVNASAADGQFGPGSYVAAARTIRLAKQGGVRAQAQLGWMYSTGHGVPQDYIEAAKWYYRAADRGDAWAQFELGQMYNKGQGVRRDYVLAEMWLDLSASRVSGENRDFVASMRDSVALKMTAPQLAAAQHLARAWYQSR